MVVMAVMVVMAAMTAVVMVVVVMVVVMVVDQSSVRADNGGENSFVENRVGAGHDVYVHACDVRDVCVTCVCV